MKNLPKSKKILGLETLQNMGLNVPKFTFIPNFEVLGLSISDLNYQYQIPVLLETLKKALSEIDESEYGYSLRSASFDEDTFDVSAAGRYYTFNGLNTLDELYQAAVIIWQHHRLNTQPNIYCPLILQKTHCSYYSGVIFRDSSSSNPIIVIESYFGSCKTIVDGMVIPYRSIFSDNEWKHDFQSQKRWHSKFAAHIGLFKNAKVSDSAGSLFHPKYTPFPEQARKYVDSDQQEVIAYGYRPESPPLWYFDKICTPLVEISAKLDTGKGVDIEWGCSSEGELFFYQYRTLTKPLFYQQTYEFDEINTTACSSNIYQGLPGSPGIAKGYISTKSDNSKDNIILMLEQAAVDNVKDVERSAGVVCSTGGILSHLAIVCRELKKPCVIGIQNIIPENSQVEINGNLGRVTVIDT